MLLHLLPVYFRSNELSTSLISISEIGVSRSSSAMPQYRDTQTYATWINTEIESSKARDNHSTTSCLFPFPFSSFFFVFFSVFFFLFFFSFFSELTNLLHALFVTRSRWDSSRLHNPCVQCRVDENSTLELLFVTFTLTGFLTIVFLTAYHSVYRVIPKMLGTLNEHISWMFVQTAVDCLSLSALIFPFGENR